MPRSSSKLLLCVGIAVAILSTGYFLGGYAQKRRNLDAQGWLTSQATFVQLGAWDKAGASDARRLVFIVTAPNGKQYKAEKPGPASEEWAYVSFPGDFDSYPDYAYTSYTWKCLADGKQVASGQFKYGGDRSDVSTR
jgi:hypothetical protein